MINGQNRNIKNFITMLASKIVFFTQFYPFAFSYMSGITSFTPHQNMRMILPIVFFMNSSNFFRIIFPPFFRTFNVSLFIFRIIIFPMTLFTATKLSIRLKCTCNKIFFALNALLFSLPDRRLILEPPIFFQAKSATILNGFVVESFSYAAYKFFTIIRKFFVAVCTSKHIDTSYANL